VYRTTGSDGFVTLRYPVVNARYNASIGGAECGAAFAEQCRRGPILDLYCDDRHILVRAGIQREDRAVPMPERLSEALQEQGRLVRRLCEKDREAGVGSVFMPDAMARKYRNASGALRWHFLFPDSRVARDPGSLVPHRHHIHRSVVQKAIRQAPEKAGISKRVTSHTQRHSFATNCWNPARTSAPSWTCRDMPRSPRARSKLVCPGGADRA
jgi:hypothetical protein